MPESARLFPAMLAVALLLHGALLAWWQFPQSEAVPAPERPIIQMVKLAQPPAPELPRAIQPPPPKPASPPPPRPAPKPQPESKPLPPMGPAPMEKALSPDPPPVAQEDSHAPPEEVIVAPQAPASHVLAGYEAQLAAWLDRHKNYPLAAQRRCQEGEVLLRIRIDRQGWVLSFLAQDMSGHRILDEAALAMVKRAEPFPPFPDDFPGGEFEFLIPVVFRLR